MTRNGAKVSTKRNPLIKQSELKYLSNFLGKKIKRDSMSSEN